MKRLMILSFVFVLLFSFTGCIPMQQQMKKPASFYYLSETISYGDPEGFIRAEQVETSHLNSVEEILTVYLSGPISADLISPFPSDVQITTFNINPFQTTVTLSRKISALSDIKLTVACACLAKTILNITDTQAVVIQIENGDSAVSEAQTFTRENLILYDDPVGG